jgi:hypothetical protein
MFFKGWFFVCRPICQPHVIPRPENHGPDLVDGRAVRLGHYSGKSNAVLAGFFVGFIFGFKSHARLNEAWNPNSAI